MSCFTATDILLPNKCDIQKWAAIACDQYTSQPEYWHSVKAFVGSQPSTLHLFIPEAELHSIDPSCYDNYRTKMLEYLNAGILKEYPSAYIYVERTLLNGQIRQGIVGVIDLEAYDYEPKPNTKVYATEATVLERVPPRIALRKGAALEFSHTVIFCNDTNRSIIEAVADRRDSLCKLYEFELMENGGHISGYLLDQNTASFFEQAIQAYEADQPYLVGDGNHSLVTAKLSYEVLKLSDPDADWSKHPARYAMVELENIHSPAMLFEPIYRIMVCQKPHQLIQDLQKLDDPDGQTVTLVYGEEEFPVRIHTKPGELIIEALQHILDEWINRNSGTIDYIHGADAVRKLATDPNTVGFLLPDFDKTMLFPYILSGKVMPRKSFSIGHAEEKRYYLEGRKIL